MLITQHTKTSTPCAKRTVQPQSNEQALHTPQDGVTLGEEANKVARLAGKTALASGGIVVGGVGGALMSLGTASFAQSVPIAGLALGAAGMAAGDKAQTRWMATIAAAAATEQLSSDPLVSGIASSVKTFSSVMLMADTAGRAADFGWNLIK